jgi:sulfide:quinone oxidoreductase
MQYVKKYRANLNFNANLVKVDGASKRAWFDVRNEQGEVSRLEKHFDMLHVVPPQAAPEFIAKSILADANGWCDVDQTTLRHKRYENIYSLGDVINAPNAKTAAAARKQIVVVAENLIASRELRQQTVHYDGYGACPLTVAHGKVVLAEFGYGGKLLPTFPLNPIIPRRLGWLLKATVMPWLYWNLMLKGREWLARPSAEES